MEARTIGEAPVALTVNSEVWLTFMCTPQDLEALALGFMYNEGVIQSMDDVVDVRPCEHGDNVDIWLKHKATQPKHWRRTSGCTGGMSSAALTADLDKDKQTPDSWEIAPGQVLHLVRLLLEKQDKYRETGGVHAAALSDGERILITAEDVGRHNTIDKVTGKCLQDGVWPRRKILLTTGRISSEMLNKAARMRIPVVASRTSPTSMSVALAKAWNITLIGYARRDSLNVYAGQARIAEEDGERRIDAYA